MILHHREYDTNSLNTAAGLSNTAEDISTMLFGSGSGGLTAELTGEDGALRKCPVDIFSEWGSMRRESQGAATGLAVSALNHVAHRMSRPLSRLQGDSEPWDLNGDGILQKVEADLWGVKEGTDITVDNSKIDWTGLEIPEGYKDGKNLQSAQQKHS